jgi:NAD(P)-dependent dehydrogenase (short-subunit alcohol dehydrogenase family)
VTYCNDPSRYYLGNGHPRRRWGDVFKDLSVSSLLEMKSDGFFFVRQAFEMTGRVAIITGGAGMLGVRHAETVAEFGGVPVVVDLDAKRAHNCAAELREKFGVAATGFAADITDPEQVRKVRDHALKEFGRIDVLINNAANNPKVEDERKYGHWSRLEDFPLDVWHQDIAVGLTGAFLCSQTFGSEMARVGRGVILNIASDLGVIGPDQRIYREAGESERTQMVKPVSYSVVKAALIGLTRYLATYWPTRGVRANALAPGGVLAGQDEAFVERLTSLIPMGRLAHKDEYKAAVAFMISDASSYMNGAIVNIDGGRTTW